MGIQATLQSGQCRGPDSSSEVQPPSAAHPVAGPLSPAPAAASIPPPVGQPLLPGGQRLGKGRGWGLAATQPPMPCRMSCRTARPEPPAVLDNADGGGRPTGLVSLLQFHRSPAPPARLSSLRGAAEVAGTAGSGVHRSVPGRRRGRMLLITLPMFGAAPRYAHSTGSRGMLRALREKPPCRRSPHSPVPTPDPSPGALSRSRSRSQILVLVPCPDPRSQSR